MSSVRSALLISLLLLLSGWAAIAAPGRPTLTLTDRPGDNGDGVVLTVGKSADDGGGANNVIQYRVYHKEGSDAYTVMATLGANGAATYVYTATGLTRGVWHAFAVTARDNTGAESAMVERAIAPQDEQAPGRPTLTLTDPPNDNGDTCQLTIGRSADDGAGVNDVKIYTVYHKEGSSPYTQMATIAPTGAATYTYWALNLTQNVWHTFAVTAKDATGNESVMSERAIALKNEQIPSRPTLTLVDNPNDNGDSCQLVIGKSADDGGGANDVKIYTVYHKVGSDPYAVLGTVVATGAATYTYWATNLTQNVWHGFAVTATDRWNNESSKAEAAIALKNEQIPSRPTLTLVDNPNDNGDSCQLVIGKSADDGGGANDVKLYTVYHKTGSNPYTPLGTIVATGAATYTYWATNLTQNVWHGFGVSATDRWNNESTKAEAAIALKNEQIPSRPTLTLVDPPNDNGDTCQLIIGKSADDGGGANDVKLYTVYHKTGANPYTALGTIVATGAATYTWWATNLTQNLYQGFAVSATDRWNNESTKAEAAIDLKNEQIPSRPTLTLTDVPNDNGTAVQLTIGKSADDGGGANDVKLYTIYHKTGSSAYSVVTTLNATGAATYAYTATNLTPAIWHGFAVSATDVWNNQSTKAEAAILPKDEKAPGAPTLTLTDPPADDGNSLQLNIGRSPDDGTGAKDVRTYQIQHKVGSGAYANLATVTATGATSYAYLATGLTRGVSHGFAVTALDASGNVSPKAEAAATPVDSTPAQPPTNLAVEDVPDDDGTALNVSFTASADDTATDSEVTSYQIYRATSEAGAATLAGTVPATHLTVYTYRDTGRTPGTTYWYYVTAVAATGNASTPRVSGVPRDNRPVAAPSALTAADHPYDTGKVIDLTWARSGDDGIGRNHVTKYNVYRRMANVAQDPALVGAVTATGAATYAWSDTTVPMDLILYEYTLKAATSSGAESSAAGPAQAASENNNVVVFQPPTNFTVVDVAGDTGGQLLLTWNRSVSEGDIGPPPPPPVLSSVTPQGGYGGTYEFYRRPSTGTYGTVPTFSVSAAGTNNPMTYIDSGLTNGTRYYYKVRYRRYNQISNFTAEASAIPVNNISGASVASVDDGTSSTATAPAAGLAVRLVEAPQTASVGQDLVLTAAVSGNQGAGTVYLQYSLNGAAAARTAAVSGQGDFTARLKLRTNSLPPGAIVQVRAVVVSGSQTAVSSTATITVASP